MDKDKEKQEISIVGRLLSIEALLVLMGVVCLVSGIITGEPMQLFWGGMIICGSVVLFFVKRKDWKKHWEEQERIQKVYMEMRRLEQEKKEQEKKNDARG
jgi:flagellar biosynthesis component FlhA